MQYLLNFLPADVLTYVRQVPSIWWWYAANGAFLMFCCASAYFSFYCFRRARGYEKFKGSWYSPESLQNLKQELYSGVRDGRLPDRETMAFLDRHIYGKESQLRKINGKGWI